MKTPRPCLIGASLAVMLVVVLWTAMAFQFGGVGNGVRYLEGYNYLLSPTTIDVGQGARGERRSATVTVRNLSLSPIRVIGAITTCNCLVVDNLPVTIAPREAMKLQLAVYLESSEGQVDQLATLLIDDGQMQRAPVRITGRCNSPK